MNERIKEFFSEATFEPDRLVDGVYHPYIPLQFSNEPWRYTITDDGIQKFAELLIKECANQCTHDGPFTAEVVWGKQFREKILKHFGVE